MGKDMGQLEPHSLHVNGLTVLLLGGTVTIEAAAIGVLSVYSHA